MIGLLKSEFRKVITVRMTYILLLASVFLSLLYVVSYAVLAGYDFGAGQMLPPLTAELSVRMVYSSVGSSYLVALVSGVLGFTSETRHRTLSATYLATPQRGRVLAAKFFVQLIAGTAMGLVTAAIGTPVAMALVNRGAHWEMPTADIWSIGYNTVGAYALWSVVGIAVGALIRNQIAATVGSLFWVMIVERIFLQLLPNYGKWLPGGASSAMLQARSINGQEYLQPQQGAFLLLGYAVVLSVIAALTTNRADVS